MCACSSSPGGELRHGATARGTQHGVTVRGTQHGVTVRGTQHGVTASGTQHGAMLRCAALALLCAALAHADRGKRAEMSPVPFVMGSRYGRSPERVMTPRNDRFFMGSRYGKRSETAGERAGGSEVRAVWEGCEVGAPPAQCRLLCRYAGVPHLYKCVRTHTQHYDRRNVADARAGDSDE